MLHQGQICFACHVSRPQPVRIRFVNMLPCIVVWVWSCVASSARECLCQAMQGCNIAWKAFRLVLSQIMLHAGSKCIDGRDLGPVPQPSRLTQTASRRLDSQKARKGMLLALPALPCLQAESSLKKSIMLVSCGCQCNSSSAVGCASFSLGLQANWEDACQHVACS